MAWFGSPARVLVIHAFVTVQWVIAAIWSALRSSTSNTVSHMASVGPRIEYWICPMPGAMLSAAACPAIGMNSLSVQLPACGSIDSFIILEFVYIRQTASMAPGARAMAWAWVTVPAPMWACHVSG